MDLLELERQRLLLEENLTKLKASLKHYQTLTAEYEGLSEEIQANEDGLDLRSISKTYAGDIVNEKEIQDLAGLPHSPRSGSQVLDLISKRQEYVQKNIETLQRQFWDAEAKLEELDFAAFSNTRDHRNNALPLTEIHEELDEDGNVISSSVVEPEAATGRLVDTLRKAGFSDADLDGDDAGDKESLDKRKMDSTRPGATALLPPALVKKNRAPDLNPHQRSDSEAEASSERPSLRKKSVSFTADTKPPPISTRQESEDGRRSVSFNDKVAVMPSAHPPDNRSVSFAAQVEEIPIEARLDIASTGENAEPNVEDKKSESDVQKALRQFMFKPGDKVSSLNSDDEIAGTHIVLPEGESEDDAAMRREMLEYHLNEVGHVVAQMDLDEDDYDLDENASTSDFQSSEYPEEDTPYTSGVSDSDVESEDEYGRSTRKVISDDYHKEMQKLQQKLIGNLGPAPTATDVAEVDIEVDAQHVRRLVVQESGTNASLPTTAPGVDHETKKRVSFAEAPTFAQEQEVTQRAAGMLRDENEAPLADMVLERAKEANSPSVPAGNTEAPAQMSRFKSSQKAALQSPSSAGSRDSLVAATPGGPPGRTIAEDLIERPIRTAGAVAPSADEQDPIMQRRELAEEYYRRRNNVIRQQGGFKADASDDDAQGELMEERDGKLKKVSRFRAARIK